MLLVYKVHRDHQEEQQDQLAPQAALDLLVRKVPQAYRALPVKEPQVLLDHKGSQEI